MMAAVKKPDGWVDERKVRKIMRLIDDQIVKRQEQTLTFVKLKKAILQRNVRGQLRESDLAYIKHTIKKELK